MKIAKSKLLAGFWVAACWLLPLASGRQQPSTPADASGQKQQITVDGSQAWVDTKIDLLSGAQVRFTSTGEVTYPPKGKTPERKFGPSGLNRGFEDLIHAYPVADAGHGSLIGRVGPPDASQPFLVGGSKDFTAPIAGRLFLGINQSLGDASAAQGGFQVTVELTNPAGTPPQPAPSLCKKSRWLQSLQPCWRRFPVASPIRRAIRATW